MMSLPSAIADNLAEGLHISKCKDFKSYIEYVKVKDKFKCLKCNKNL